MLNINSLNRGGYCDYKRSLVWQGNPANETELSSYEAKRILNASQSWMLRNIYDWDCGEETNFWAVINSQDRDISELPSKVRNQVRRCLKDCDIRIISGKELVSGNGYEIFEKSFERYRDVTVKIPVRISWEKGVLNDKLHEYWGVFEKTTGNLIAFSVVTQIENSINYNSLKAIPSLMNKHYPYYGLIYVMNHHYLGEMHCDFVTDGFRSITEHSNIQPFLIKNFLFRKAYCKIRLHYKTWLKLAVNIAYPFRKYIPISQIKHILNFEAINRGVL